MTLPFFYHPDLDASHKHITLDEENSAHMVQVLRMKVGEQLQLTNGKGSLATARIAEAHKKHCAVNIEEIMFQETISPPVSIGISLIKNSGRFEWFLEKAVEIGVNEIIPLICERTIREKFRPDRMNGICISAMLQSQQCWLPVLHEPIAFELLFRQEEVAARQHKFIAHCMDGTKSPLMSQIKQANGSAVILIGPEGDFTPAEVEIALSSQFMPVSLGRTRLRTETAGVVAATVLRLEV